MPFNRFEDGVGFIHATGYDCLVDGQWMTEYEDNIFEDAAGCSYEVEPEEEPEWTEEDEAQWAETFKPLLDSEFINIYLYTLYYNIYSSITLYIEL